MKRIFDKKKIDTQSPNKGLDPTKMLQTGVSQTATPDKEPCTDTGASMNENWAWLLYGG